MMRKYLNDNKGITLLALIITIIVLLILAMVSIRIILNEQMINKTNIAAIKHETASIQEALKLDAIDTKTDVTQDNKKVSIEEILQSLYNDQTLVKITITGEEKYITNSQETLSGTCYKIDPDKVKVSTPRGKGETGDIFVVDTNYNVYYILSGATITDVQNPEESEQLSIFSIQSAQTETVIDGLVCSRTIFPRFEVIIQEKEYVEKKSKSEYEKYEKQQEEENKSNEEAVLSAIRNNGCETFDDFIIQGYNNNIIEGANFNSIEDIQEDSNIIAIFGKKPTKEQLYYFACTGEPSGSWSYNRTINAYYNLVMGDGEKKLSDFEELYTNEYNTILNNAKIIIIDNNGNTKDMLVRADYKYNIEEFTVLEKGIYTIDIVNSNDNSIVYSSKVFNMNDIAEIQNNPLILSEEAAQGIWEIESDGDLHSVTYKGTSNNVIIPVKIGNKNIVGVSGFKNNTNIQSILIPEGIRIIGEEAFAGCTSLESVVTSGSTAVIYYKAFSGCSNLRKFEILRYGPMDIYYPSPTTVFEGCTNLTEIRFKNNVEINRSNAPWGAPNSNVQVIYEKDN